MVTALFKKEFTLELRRKSVVSGLVLYLFSTAFICYLTFNLRQNLATPLVWSALFWITILFTAVNSVAKSFIGEKKGRDIYYYSIANPAAIIISKILYNFLLCALLSASGYWLFFLFLGSPIHDKVVFAVLVLLTSMGFASSLTLLSSIAAKANNSTILMAVLSFPVVITILLMAIKVTKNCIDQLGWDASWDELLTLFSINCLVAAVSYLLFPYIWRS
ncbi:MAG TPA: heme exporter protein CcmB [Cyclobacteriaceae bacterium]|nr:heme exporter protein CcmB [Cyclobacteriaceae bacterium]MCB9238028.1 heme exporter protein CcmB [Flammeovirgaceae bacterium]MCB0499132.1 heme exporter protein CcmB [Cyclobacteriaceae bacterium]MCO5272936.1 heme exporter protein CcmB [Cyclobacteriaceae bacterium]MCW5901648.1 heme exporter protein CcmB [Cyclobacteriaceae bacterium]